MKKFIIISIVILMGSIDAMACWDLGPNHNQYLFSVFRREMMNNELFKDDIDTYWKNYTNGAVKQYRWNEEEIMAYAKKKNDTEMQSYLEKLSQYLEICEQLRSTWTYPTKEELQQRKINLLNMIKTAREHQGTRLAPQWNLLQMRANMVLGNNMDNVKFWEETGSKQGESVFRSMMENIYAGSLLRLGQRTKACEIYAKQGDMVSIKWAMRKHRNLAGIKAIMAENPNSLTMNFLVQDFVNNAQENLDSEDDWLEVISVPKIQASEMKQFVNYAQEVVDGKKSQSPAMWLAAIGEIQWLLGNDAEAMKALDKAVNAAGTQRMKDNARAIRMVVSVRPSKMDKKYTNWMSSELKWLNNKIKEEALENGPIEDPDYNSPYYYNHYYDVLDRLVFSNLVPKYDKMGNKNAANALTAMMNKSDRYLGLKFNEEIIGWNPEYSSDYFRALDTLSIPELENFKKWTEASSGDALEQLARPYTQNAEYLNDIIGTRYLADGNFSKAVPYLEKVSTKFLNKQNIGWYMQHRDYTTARWLKRQADDETGESEGPDNSTLTKNPKVEFCQEMMKLEGQIGTANAETRAKLAYDLAVRYYQASYKGECWWLTQYGSSVYDEAVEGRADFVAVALKYLEQAKASNDFNIKQNSLYGLAFVPNDEWAEFEYDWQSQKNIITPKPQSRQYKALAELDTFERQNKGRVAKYISKCDVLDTFRNNR